LRPIGTFCGLFGIFSRFGMLQLEKSGNPDVPLRLKNRPIYFSFGWSLVTSRWRDFFLNYPKVITDVKEE
jgi:hypothetical protein